MAVLLLGAAWSSTFSQADSPPPDDPLRDYVDRFYGAYPCLQPHPMLEEARQNPEPLRALFYDTGRPGRERYAAYYLLVRANAAGFEQVIRAAIVDSDPWIRCRAVHSLGMVFDGAELVDNLTALLHDESLLCRYDAVENLARLSSDAAAVSVEPLLSMLGDDSIEVRHLALGTLLKWGTPHIHARIRELARSRDRVVAGAAMHGLAWLEDDEFRLQVLHRYARQELRALTGPPYNGTGSVVGIIRQIGSRQELASLPVLRKAARHRHSYIRAVAAETIVRIAAQHNLPARATRVLDQVEREPVVSLDLSHTPVADAGLVHLWRLPDLEKLSLVHTAISGEGLAHLKGNWKLRELRLSYTRLSDSTATSLRLLTSLEELHLSATSLTDPGLESLLPLQSLKTLVLNDLGITDDGLQHLERLPKLRKLVMRGAQITDAGLQRLQGIKSLRSVWLHETQVTDEAVAALKSARPDLEVFR